MRNFCTYFDSHYLSRGLALLLSLRRHAGEFRLFVLCLDDKAFQYLQGLGDTRLVPLTLHELERDDSQLYEVKPNRDGAEYYFTLTPALALWLMPRINPGDLLTYLDADMMFFADPRPLFDEIGLASVGIVPHGFSRANQKLRRYGLYNVAWVSWRRDATGLACLRDYRRDCLAWCHDYPDGSWYADQRYLDSWPGRYRALRIIEHPGANLAPWNLDARRLEKVAGQFRVDGRELVFHHFHKFRLHPDGSYDDGTASYRTTQSADAGQAQSLLYDEYARTLRHLHRLPGVAPARLGSGVRNTASSPSSVHNGLPAWERLSQGWVEDAAQFPGWEAESAVQAAKETWIKVQRRRQTQAPPVPHVGGLAEKAALAGLLAAASLGHGRRASMLDWGGGPGSDAWVLDMILPQLDVDYHCADLPAQVELGRALDPGRVAFHPVHADQCPALERDYDLVYCGASLQYARHWQPLLQALARAARQWLVITRLPVVYGCPGFVCAQRMFHTRLATAANCWILNRLELFETLSGQGLELQREFPIAEQPWVLGAPETPEIQGYIFHRKTPAPAAEHERPGSMPNHD